MLKNNELNKKIMKSMCSFSTSPLLGICLGICISALHPNNDFIFHRESETDFSARCLALKSKKLMLVSRLSCLQLSRNIRMYEKFLYF